MPVYDIELRNIVKEFPGPRGKEAFRAVDDVNLQIRRGEFFALLGPSGCGKTTTLRLIAGFEQPTSGELLIRGKAMQDVPPFHRPVNTVFQDYALFPHMTVLQNVMFGLQMERVPQKEAVKRAQEALDLVRLPQVADRKPSQLSGGQQQRIALARALVKRPAVLLLDEPLGALDLKLRKEMQYELKSMQQQVGITFIYVTHDQEEAMTMADRIAVMNGGEVLQIGSPRQIYEYPATHFVADFIGETNFIEGELVDHQDGVGIVRLTDGSIIRARLPEDHEIESGTVTVPIRPERIGLMNPEEEAAFNQTYKGSGATGGEMTYLSGVLVDSQYIGTDTRYTVRVAGDMHITVRWQNIDYKQKSDFSLGQDVKVFWPLASTTILDR